MIWSETMTIRLYYNDSKYDDDYDSKYYNEDD